MMRHVIWGKISKPSAILLTVAADIAGSSGRIPRSMASHFVRLFNMGELPVLICTSTLNEGVNTAAKSVLIFDKQISRQEYDFFTFANIRRRAGRLGQHQIGSAYLFHAPVPTVNQIRIY